MLLHMAGICGSDGLDWWSYKKHHRGYITALFSVQQPKYAHAEQATQKMTLKLQCYFVLTSCYCHQASRLLLFYETRRAGRLSGTNINLLKVQTVQVLRDELTCKKEMKVRYKIEEILKQIFIQRTYTSLPGYQLRIC